MKRTILLFSLALCLPALMTTAQNDLDSALVVNEIASEDSDTVSQKSTWTFNTGSTTVTVDADGDIDEMESAMEEFGAAMDEFSNLFEKFGRNVEKFAWVPVVCMVLLCLLPLLLLFLILFFTYKGRKAKYSAYQKMAESGQPIPQEMTRDMTEGDIKMRNDGISNICVGVGLAIFLGLIIGKFGIAIGALVTCIGIGKLIIWYLSREENTSKREK